MRAMDVNGFATVFFFFLVFAGISDASLFSKLRNLAEIAPNPKSNSTQVTPLPSPVPVAKDLDPKLKKVDNSTDLVVPNNSSKVDPNGSNNTESASPPPSINKIGKENNNQQHETKKDDKADSHSGSGENCDGLTNICGLLDSSVACIRTSENGSGAAAVIIQNEGESTLKVHLSVPNSVEFASTDLEILKHQTKRINISLSISSTEVILNAGNGNCVLRTGAVLTEGDYFLHLPSYDKVVTPINGAYLLICTVVILGGAWACCKFRKRRWQGGVPYQELEMGLSETAPSTIVETAEGWDQDWDDSWDDDKAVRSPAAHHVGNISANGLTARSSNKDGWENDWDD